jgi:hypothetical protein
MDFAQVLRELWLRRAWLALGVVVALIAGLSTAYRIGVLPPKLTERALSIGAADTQILIDSPESALTDLGTDFKPFADRAQVYARFMTSRPVREAIAREVGLEDQDLIVSSPPSPNQTREQREPAATRRDNDLLGETNQYRLHFSTDPGLPTITIGAQAPRVEDAVRLADAAAIGFRKYVAAVQQRQDVPPERRVTVRQLGAAQGGVVAEDINRPLAILTFVAVFIAWCLLVLLASNVARSMRQLDEAGTAGDVQDTLS